MFAQSFTPSHLPLPIRPERPTFNPRFKELIAMCFIRLNETDHDPSLLELARRCKTLLEADLSPEFEVVFTGLSLDASARLTKFRKEHRLNTISDFVRHLPRLKPGSDHCPNCGEKTLHEPVLFCSDCGANPATVYEKAGGVLLALSP